MKLARDAWCAEHGVSLALAQFDDFGAGAALEQCPRLDEVFIEPDRTEDLMHRLVRHFCAALSANPLGHPPFRNGYDGRTSNMLLAKSGRAQLLLQAREPGRYDGSCASFSHALRYDAVLAGQARATIQRIRETGESAQFFDEAINLRGGVRLSFDCSSETLHVEQVDTRLVTLRLLQVTEKPGPGREYCCRTGRLLQQTSATLATSRREMMVALVGRMGRIEAAPVLADMALADGDDSLRWQALRECLALDSVHGFVALVQIARNAADSLSASAGALRAQLVEAHPQLLDLETSQCRA